MKTFIIVKASSKRYHIYNALGNCVAVVASREDIDHYFDAELTTSPCTSIVFRYTAAAGTFIVTLK